MVAPRGVPSYPYAMQPNLVAVRSDTGSRRHSLLLVHGAWHGAWCWEPFMEWFAARGWDSYAIDLRGHGESGSDRSLRLTRVKHYVEDVASVVESMDSPPIIVAHSMGGLIAQRFLENHELPGAVLLSPVPIGGAMRATLRTLRRHPLKFLKANVLWDLKPLIEKREIAADLFLTDDATPEQVDWMWDRLQSESYLAYLDMLFFVRSRPQLVHSPMAVITGSEDRIFGVGEHRKTARAYGIELEVMDGAAHDLMLGPHWEEAAQATADAAERF